MDMENFHIVVNSVSTDQFFITVSILCSWISACMIMVSKVIVYNYLVCNFFDIVF